MKMWVGVGEILEKCKEITETGFFLISMAQRNFKLSVYI